jgi:hypothetical protein
MPALAPDVQLVLPCRLHVVATSLLLALGCHTLNCQQHVQCIDPELCNIAATQCRVV